MDAKTKQAIIQTVQDEPELPGDVSKDESVQWVMRRMRLYAMFAPKRFQYWWVRHMRTTVKMTKEGILERMHNRLWASAPRPQGYPNTPELDKLLEVQDDSHTIGEFLNWLQQKHRMSVCEYGGEDPDWWPTHKTTEQLLAMYFDIDLNEVEKERLAVLEYVQ